MQGCDEQHERRQALLSVDQHEMGASSSDDAAVDRIEPMKWVSSAPHPRRRGRRQQLLAASDVPSVLALIHRHDDGRFGCREPAIVLTAVAETFAATDGGDGAHALRKRSSETSVESIRVHRTAL
jgi:hypothetical protein